MKRIFRKILRWFIGNGATQDTWNNSSPLQQSSVSGRQYHREGQEHNRRPNGLRNSTSGEFREDMTNNEFAAETCTQEHNGIRIMGMTNGGDIPSSFTHESFTENGLIEAHLNTFTTTADGRFIKPEELHGGGNCECCGFSTDKLFFCSICHMPLCSRCARTFKGGIVCPVHFEVLNFQNDTWEKHKDE